MYIFLMDQGRLVSLDDNLLSQTVSSLRNVLAHDFDLPLNKQILLVSGGFQLEPGDKLSTYGAGLDKTNPIYVFTQTFPSDTNVQKPDVLQVNDGGYPRQLANLSELTPSEKVFEERLRLIHAITPISRETANAIEQLVSEQRQMIQGWCVALANLAEVAADTNKRLLFATSRLVQFEECITDWERKLHNFHELKKELSDLPLLPQLVVLDSSTEYNHQKESFNFNSIPKPTNMYEWVCLQSAMSSVGTRYFPPPSAIKSVGLQSGGLYHVRQGSGRIRTTSTGQLGGYSTTESTVVTTQPHQVHFYTGGSQSSLNNAGTGCSNSPTLDTRIQRDQSLAGVGGGGGGGGDSSSAHESTVFDYYESAFLEIIKRAIQDIHLLRFGPDSQICSTTKQQSDASSELNYVRAHTNRLSELITMVNACSKSNYDEMTAASTHPSTESSAMPGVQHLLVDSSKTVAAATERARTSSISSLLSLNLTREHDIHLISIRDALDPGYFSQRLSQLDPLACEAIDLARRIIGIEQAATKAFQQIVQQKLNSLLQTKFTENTVNSQELIIAFNRLCEILGIIMQSKLLLANNLSDRQRWLQNFQSELNRLDAIIQNCLRRMCRVTTTGTLISQLGEAGSTYARCLAEIVRRTEFEDMLTQRSVYYLKEENSLRAEECRRRRIFSKHLKNNVLHTLFSPWTNPKTDCIGLINLPTSITMSQDVTEQQLCEITSTVSTVSTTVTTQKVDSSSHCHPVTPELAVSRRFALSSLSEPRLNELAKVCALHRVNSRVRSNRLNSLSSPDPQLAKVKEGEMIESIRKKYTDSSYTSASSQHQHHQTLPHHVVVNLRQHTQPVVDSNRRASIPLDQDRETTVSNWSVDSSSVGLTNHFCTSNTLFSIGKQPVKITREDLEKLMSSMPSSVCNLLRTELNKSFTLLKSSSCIGGGGYNNLLDQSSVTTGLKLTSTTTTTTTTTTISANTLITEKQIDRYETKSVNTSPLCSTINQPFSSSSSSSSLHLVSVACQTQFNLIGPVINVGSGRSLNSSLGLSVDDSTRRTAINNAGWEELPGSLCSWEICRFPIIRSRDRISISLNTLPRYEHLVTTATQTESSNELPETNLISNSSVPDNNDNNNPDTGAAEVDSTLQKVEKEVKYSGQNNSESPQEYDSEVYHFPFHSSLPHDDICQESKVLSTSPQSILSTEINDENVVLSSIFTEDDLFTDSTLMMTSSFHSTRTTFSNNIYDNTTTNNNNNNKADSSSQHTALMSVSQSRSVSLSRSSSSSSNLCDITGGVGSTTTQYGSVIYDDVKTSQNVMLLSSCSSSSPPPPLPRIEIPVSESTDQQNQTTTSLSSSTLLFDKCCSQCQLKYAHHKEYFNLLQQCLQLIDKRVNHHQQQQQGEEEEQAKNSDKLRIQKPITLSIETTPRSPLISLDSSQLKCLFNVLESCSSLFLKSKSTTCISHENPSVETTDANVVGNTGDDNDADNGISHQNNLSTTLTGNHEKMINSTSKECPCHLMPTMDINEDTLSSQFDFVKSLHCLVEKLNINNSKSTVCMSTSTTPSLQVSSESALTQTEVIQAVDVATSITFQNQTIEGNNSDEKLTSTCLSSSSSPDDINNSTNSHSNEDNSNGSNSSNYLTVSSENNHNSLGLSPQNTSYSTSPASSIPLQQHGNGNKQKSNILNTSSCYVLSGVSMTSTERYTSFVHSNFAPNDIVIFVPVPGSKANTSASNTSSLPFSTETSPTTTTSTVTPTTSCVLSQDNYTVVKSDSSKSQESSTILTKSDIWSMSNRLSSNLLDAVISPSSSLLSSMIVQSSLPLCSSIFMSSGGGGGDSGSGSSNQSTTPMNNNNNNTLPVMHKSTYPNSTVLANELYTSTFNDTVMNQSKNFYKNLSQITKTTANEILSPISISSQVQWRMLSSDGHVYFLHQDDFKALNIDDHTDYCKPLNSNLQETNSIHPRSSSFKEAFPTHNYFIVARYQSKERCLSKKANNRFNLPKNFIFYRVRACPLNSSSESSPLPVVTESSSLSSVNNDN